MRLAISFSGGRTSAFMMAMLLHREKDFSDIRITFANTGLEHPATLDFINECDKRIAGGRVVWLEAVVDPTPGVGIRHKVVSYETASRNGEPFRDYIAKYGIPNATTPNCTSRLKQDVMEHYLRGQGFFRGKALNYWTAIGIRADELDRASATHREQQLCYPLLDAGITKSAVMDYWRNQSFDLNLPGEHYGNCVTCWKKSDRKLATIARENPHMFNFMRDMEREYGLFKADGASSNNGRRYFFRKHRTVDDIFELAKKPFHSYQDRKEQLSLIPLYDPELDIGSGCSESCEVGADEAA